MKTSGKKLRAIYIMGVFVCSYLSFFFLILSGIIGERLPIRYYLTFGMLASGTFTALFGLGYFYNIHSFGFYVVTQVQSGSVAHHVQGFCVELDGVFMSQVPASARRDDGSDGVGVGCVHSSRVSGLMSGSGLTCKVSLPSSLKFRQVCSFPEVSGVAS